MTETLHTGRFLKLVKQGNWEYVERVNAKAVVVILAVTPDKKLILVEQNRIPVGKRCIELPAGLAGDVASDVGPDMLVNAAKRELLEETGYEAGKMTLVHSGPSSCGMTSEVVNLFRARDLKKVGAGGGDESEDIIVHEVDLKLIEPFLADMVMAGRLTDPKIYTGLYFLLEDMIHAPASSGMDCLV